MHQLCTKSIRKLQHLGQYCKHPYRKDIEKHHIQNDALEKLQMFPGCKVFDYSISIRMLKVWSKQELNEDKNSLGTMTKPCLYTRAHSIKTGQ